MPHYFFHLDAPGAPRSDRVGVTLPDAEAAWFQAVRCARDEIAARGDTAELWKNGVVHIVDDAGEAIDRVPLLDIATFAGGLA